MKVYYNEWDDFAAKWLEALIAGGHLPAGDVDRRSISDVAPSDLRGYDQCHFFAGIGGWPYALALAGFDGPVWTGSCPCQPFSNVGDRRGTADARHLWPEFHHLIAECCPSTIFGEQVASKDGREWLAGVRADLEALGYAIGAADLCAAGVGAPQLRQRLYWVANADAHRGEPWINQVSRRSYTSSKISSTISIGGSSSATVWAPFLTRVGGNGNRYRLEALSEAYPLAHGVPARVGRLRGYGNAIVPQVAAAFVTAYMEAIGG
jgi:DNA (cytosine-5)-methyltransferase 1